MCLPKLYNLINNYEFTMYSNKCNYPIPTSANQQYPLNQPYLVVIPQHITYKQIYHHNSALNHKKIKFTKVWLIQILENGHTRHLHGNIYTYCLEGSIKIYSVIKWAPAYVNNNNVHIASNLHSKIIVKSVILLPYKIPMDEELDMIYNQVSTTTKTSFDHRVTLPNTTTISSKIMVDNTVDMTTL